MPTRDLFWAWLSMTTLKVIGNNELRIIIHASYRVAPHMPHEGA